MRKIIEFSGASASRNTLTKITLVIWIAIGFMANSCPKKSTGIDESDKFIQVFAAYLNRVPGAHSPDSLRSTILDSLCQEYHYSLVTFQKRMTQLKQEPEKWSQVMERVHKQMMQLKMPQATAPPPASTSTPATPKL